MPTPSFAQPEQFWVTLLGTNSALATLTPESSQIPSFRLRTGIVRRFRPWTAFPTDVLFLDESASSAVLTEMSSLEISSWPVLAKFGRALLASYTSKERDSTTSRIVPSATATSHLDPALALAKLLNRPGFQMGDLDFLSSSELIGLLSQRLSFDFCQNKKATGQPRVSMRSFLSNQVQSHLRYVVEVAPEDGTLQTLTQSEPLFSFVVEEAMRLIWRSVTEAWPGMAASQCSGQVALPLGENRRICGSAFSKTRSEIRRGTPFPCSSAVLLMSYMMLRKEEHATSNAFHCFHSGNTSNAVGWRATVQPSMIACL